MDYYNLGLYFLQFVDSNTLINVKVDDIFIFVLGNIMSEYLSLYFNQDIITETQLAS